MHILHDFNVELFKNGSVATIGMFDGVHLAHQILLTELRNQSIKRQVPSVVITFWPHPRTILQPDLMLHFLTTKAEKIELIKSTNYVDYLIVIPFSKSFSDISAYDFIQDILIKGLNIKTLVLGYDHHFGKNREGNIRFFDNKKFDFEVLEIQKQEINGIAINSSNIRKLIENGEIENANLLLGKPFGISGVVIEGNKIGRTLGFPTANIEIENIDKLLPNGVFIVKVNINFKTFNGLLNIGTRPTINGINRVTEVHILNFDEDIYGHRIEISLLKKIRNEKKFESLDALKAQILLDKQKAISLF